MEILSESDADTAPNDASEESDFDGDGASDDDEYGEDAGAYSDNDDDDDDDDESEGEDEGDWQADEEADNPTGFGKPKTQKSAQKRKAKAPAPPKRKAATNASNKKKIRGQQKTVLPEATKEIQATACAANQAGSLQLSLPPAASIHKPISPVVSQLRSPAEPAAACPTAGAIRPAAAGLGSQGIGTAALGKPCPPTSLQVETSSPKAAASSAAKKLASPGPKPKTSNDKSVLMPMKQAQRHTGLPSGYKEQAAWTVQSAGLKRSSSSRRVQGGAKISVGGGRGIKGLGKSRAPAAGLKRGIKGRTGFVAPKPLAQR